MSKKDSVNISNRKASFDYTFEKMFVAGVQLHGSEVKAIRDGRVNLADAYCFFDNGELFVKNMSIQNMDHMAPHEPERLKKLLLNRKELDDLESDLNKGMTIIIVKLFTMRGMIKAEIALAKGKKNYDKRNSIKERDAKLELKKNYETNGRDRIELSRY